MASTEEIVRRASERLASPPVVYGRSPAVAALEGMRKINQEKLLLASDPDAELIEFRRWVRMPDFYAAAPNGIILGVVWNSEAKGAAFVVNVRGGRTWFGGEVIAKDWAELLPLVRNKTWLCEYGLSPSEEEYKSRRARYRTRQRANARAAKRSACKPRPVNNQAEAAAVAGVPAFVARLPAPVAAATDDPMDLIREMVGPARK
jgi:hypothetical protein